MLLSFRKWHDGGVVASKECRGVRADRLELIESKLRAAASVDVVSDADAIRQDPVDLQTRLPKNARSDWW